MSARKANISDVPAHWLIVKLVAAVNANNRADAVAVLQRLDADQYGGHDLFLIRTAHLILAVQDGNSSAIRGALEDWLAARSTAPENFHDQVVDAPELADVVTDIDRTAMKHQPRARVVITKSDRALVADLADARIQAVTENLEWLRQMGVTGTVKAIAKRYRISFANHHLREVTISSSKEWPDIIIAVDDAGAVMGSFLSH